jgi:short-subunit dehydrogenase
MKNPKNILITGGSSGIGEALALHYAQKDVFIALTGRDEARLLSVAERCREKGALVDVAVLDVCDRTGMEKWIEKINQTQPLDLVIANAGISGGTGGRVDGEPIAEARRIFDVNVTGVFNTVEPALKGMKNNEKGQIAIVSSLAGFRGWPGAPAYSASKGAVRFYGEALRGALKETNISVNVICPGFVTSRMTDVNDYDMPMKMQADKAAAIIVKGLGKNKGRICFPLPVHFTSWFLGILPDFIAQKILIRMPAKPAMELDK